MWQQLIAVGWAQARAMRNRFPQTSVGGFIYGTFTLLWYGMYAALGVALAMVLPHAPLATLQKAFPAGLLGIFLFWQVVPLLTLTAGWSLDLKKLRTFPIENDALFIIESLLRLTTAPEMLLVLLGAMTGLLRHPQIPAFRPLFLLLYIPFNLFLSLAIRDTLRQLFGKNKLRELLGILMVGLSILPAYLSTSLLGRHSGAGFLRLSGGAVAPWHAMGVLSTGRYSFLAGVAITVWIGAAYMFARWQFARALALDDEFEADASRASTGRQTPGKRSSVSRLFEWLSNLVADPLAAMTQKEFRSLRRIPRFRVIVGMACVFGALLCTQILRHDSGEFSREYFLPMVNVYGFLFLGEVLLWNIFGFDQQAAQLYFIAPVTFRTVLRAKNIVACAFLLFQTVAVLGVALLLRLPVSKQSIADEFGVAAVAAIFFLAAGNLTSVVLPRRVDPRQTFRKQASGSVQVWMLLSSAGIAVLLSFAYLARYAFDTNWAFLSVVAVEFGIGIVVYRIATDSAVERASRGCERLMNALSSGTSPLNS